MNVNKNLENIIQWIEWAAGEITGNNKSSVDLKEKLPPILAKCQQFKKSLDQIDSNLDNLDKTINFNKADNQQDEEENKKILTKNNIGVFNAQSLNSKLREIEDFLEENKDNILDEDAKNKLTKLGDLVTIDLKDLINEQSKNIKELKNNINSLETQLNENESKLSAIKIKSIAIGATASTGIIALLVLCVKALRKFKKSDQ